MRYTDICKPLAAALLLALPASAMAALAQGQDFESYPNGTANPWLLDYDLDFGFFSGGTVEQPGTTISADFALNGERVYFGSDILYTNILPGPYHCCGFGRMEMLVSAPNGVTIEYYGHVNSDGGSSEFFDQELMYSETVYGWELVRGWGVPFTFNDGDEPPPGGNSDILSIRWISVDGSPIAIDNVEGVGDAVVPEPASWAMMIAGFGLVGMAMRRRRVLA